MNSRRVQNSISSLDKDITHCEAYLSKVLKGKIDKQKSGSVKSSQYNVCSGARERTVMPFVTEPTTTMSTKQTSKPKVIPKPTFLPAKHVLCKEVFENKTATVEVTVKTKSSSGDKSRKRPRSNTLGSVNEIDGISSKDELLRQSNVIFEPPAPSKQNRNVSQRRTIHSHSRHKYPSWAHILKQRNAPCIVHSDGFGDEVGSQDLYPKGTKSVHRFKRPHKCVLSDDSFTSTTSNGSPTTDQESLHYVSKSTQCRISESTEGTRSASSNRNDGGTFSMFNPVRSLNFLIKELRGKMKKSDADENMQRIIADMEQALMRIPSEVETSLKIEYANEAPTKDETTPTVPHDNEFTSLKPPDAALSKPPAMPKVKFVEQQLTKHDKNDLLHHDKSDSEHRKSSGHSHKSMTPPVKERSETEVLKKELELKCAQLEVKCTQMELAFEHHKKERETLNQKIESQQKEVQEISSKEKDYLTTISYLKANLESMTKRSEEFQLCITELTALNTQLKEENQSLLSIRESQDTLTKRLRESTEEGERIHSQLQMMKLEREKYKILMDSKNKEIEKFRQELRDIQAFASEQIMNVKTFAVNTKNIAKQSILKNETSSDSIDTEFNLFLNKAWKDGCADKLRQPMCSSPTSSVPSSLEIYPSWQKISRISTATQRNANKTPSKEVIVLSPAENSTIKESDSELDGLLKPHSPEFKSFLVDSLSQGNEGVESSRAEHKTCQELKDDLRNLFDRIKEQTRMGIGLTLPSPPHQYSEIEPCGMSQWSDFSGESNFCSASNTEINKKNHDLDVSDLSNEK